MPSILQSSLIRRRVNVSFGRHDTTNVPENKSALLYQYNFFGAGKHLRRCFINRLSFSLSKRCTLLPYPTKSREYVLLSCSRRTNCRQISTDLVSVPQWVLGKSISRTALGNYRLQLFTWNDSFVCLSAEKRRRFASIISSRRFQSVSSLVPCGVKDFNLFQGNTQHKIQMNYITC